MYLRAHPYLGPLCLSSWVCLGACTEPHYLEVDAADDGERAAEELAGSADASAGDGQSSGPAATCVDSPSILGAECPGVVWCTERGPCDQRDKICCLTAFTADCSARSDCGLEQRAACDGPEDCGAGSVCCARDGVALCMPPAECPEPQRACHSDADCEAKRCARGFPGTFGGVPVTYLADWGFCRLP